LDDLTADFVGRVCVLSVSGRVVMRKLRYGKNRRTHGRVMRWSCGILR